MFICEDCHGKTGCKALHIAKSLGRCEVCGESKNCHDCHYHHVAGPKPDISPSSGRQTVVRSAEQEYEHWQFHIGIPNARGRPLTEAMLRKWAKDPNRRLECTFDGETWPANYWYCPRCREYKGLHPYIPEWSDWG